MNINFITIIIIIIIIIYLPLCVQMLERSVNVKEF